jgi:hypothetical protein
MAARPPAPLAEFVAGASPRLAQAVRTMWRDLGIPDGDGDGDGDGPQHAMAPPMTDAGQAQQQQHVRGCRVLAVLQHRPGAPRPLPPPLRAVPPTLTVVYEVDPARMWTRSLGEMAQALRSPHEVGRAAVRRLCGGCATAPRHALPIR